MFILFFIHGRIIFFKFYFYNKFYFIVNNLICTYLLLSFINYFYNYFFTLIKIENDILISKFKSKKKWLNEIYLNYIHSFNQKL